jgi:hypothetical protein
MYQTVVKHMPWTCAPKAHNNKSIKKGREGGRLLVWTTCKICVWLFQTEPCPSSCETGRAAQPSIIAPRTYAMTRSASSCASDLFSAATMLLVGRSPALHLRPPTPCAQCSVHR